MIRDTPRRMRTLIIATDLGQASRNAVTQGVALARDLNAEALLVHAWQPTQITVMDATIMLSAERVAEHANDLRRQLDSIADQQRARWPKVSARLLDGDIEGVIAAVVTETGDVDRGVHRGARVGRAADDRSPGGASGGDRGEESDDQELIRAAHDRKGIRARGGAGGRGDEGAEDQQRRGGAGHRRVAGAWRAKVAR